MKRKIFLITLFIVFLISGFIFRLVWFFTFQKKIVEDKFFYKELKYDKGGATTPQEAWNKYIDALEKGDIEEALLYIWPYERETTRERLLDIREKRLLNYYVKSLGTDLKEATPTKILQENEKMFITFGLVDKEKEIFLINLQDDKKTFQELFKDKPQVFPMKHEVIFKLNPYNKKWYIK